MKKILVGLLMVPAMAAAEFRSGNQLYTEMQSSSIVDQMVSLGYIMGIADAMNGINHCPPANVTAGQLRDMVKNFMETNPKIRHFTADIIVMGVFKQTWPCEQKKNGTRL